MQGFIIFPQKPLEQQAADKPEWGVVKADYFGQIPAGVFVIPGTQFAPVEPYAGEKFPDEDQAGVDQAADDQIAVFDKTADWRKKGGHPINGEHPDGSGPRKFQISSAEGMKGREGDFQKPSQQSAVYEVVNQFFHSYSMDGNSTFIQ